MSPSFLRIDRRAGVEVMPDAQKALYVLLHSLAETGRVKVLGIYSSRNLAEAAEGQARVLPGFSEEPLGFTIELYEVDRSHWPRGFIRL